MALNIPATGDLPGAWGTTAVNANMQVLDGIIAGNQNISLTGSSATTLSIATGVIGTGSITPSAGPVQSANRTIAFSGTLSSNCVVTMPRPGSWIVKNGCTVGAFYLQMRATGTGNLIGIPPGEFVEVVCDGTNMDFVGLGRIGTYTDLAVSSVPAWINACTLPPYLLCDGSTYAVSIAPTLAVMLGSTFGGNGITTFGVPNAGNKARVAIGTDLTTLNCGINGAQIGATGGTTTLQAHTHNAVVTDPGHVHTYSKAGPTLTGSFSGNAFSGLSTENTGTASTGITVANSTTGSGSSGNVQPTFVHGLTFIRAA